LPRKKNKLTASFFSCQAEPRSHHLPQEDIDGYMTGLHNFNLLM